jgi:hypothetical protein
MNRFIRCLASLLFIGHFTSASAQQINPDALQYFDLSALSCYTSSIQSATIVLQPYDTQRISIGNGSSYYTEPKCFHHIAQFTVPTNAGSELPGSFPYYTQHKMFSFDSLVNELIDTQSKCMTYSQVTKIFRKQGGGNWVSVGYTRFGGSWINNKCKINVVAGETDFRTETYQPRSNGTDYYRVASLVTTGTGASKVPRGVCIGLRFADIQDVPQRSCTMPE